MRVTVDTSRCEVHGECVIAAPEVFDIGDDDEVVQILDDDPPEKVREKVENAAKLCPLAAISLS